MRNDDDKFNISDAGYCFKIKGLYEGDCNNLAGGTNTGCYRNVNGIMTNTPLVDNGDRDGNGLVLVFIGSNYCTVQIYINTSVMIWARIHWSAGNDGVWTAWKKII